jgi:hypothetical protein
MSIAIAHNVPAVTDGLGRGRCAVTCPPKADPKQKIGYILFLEENDAKEEIFNRTNNQQAKGSRN